MPSRLEQARIAVVQSQALVAALIELNAPTDLVENTVNELRESALTLEDLIAALSINDREAASIESSERLAGENQKIRDIQLKTSLIVARTVRLIAESRILMWELENRTVTPKLSYPNF